MMDKGWLTNTVALGITGGSFVVEGALGESMRMAGLFALSGAVTNQLAVHMLFEKIPYLYGSGIIPERFESIRNAIKTLVMEQFFSPRKIEEFVASQERKIDLTAIIEETDFSPAYHALVRSLMDSPLGAMIGMFGGDVVIDKLREPFVKRIKASTIEISQSASFLESVNKHLHAESPDLAKSIEGIVESRLAELTPELVKQMLHDLMREHLGWLVVWGGVFGGAIGLVSSLLL